MAKTQVQGATNAGLNLSGQGSGPTPSQVVTPSVQTATGQQNQQIANSGQTLATQQSQVAPAQTAATSLAQTGGFSPQQETTYLNRATQGVAGTYDVLGQQAKNQEAATGGLGTGGQISQMARQGTQAQAQATEGAQADLTQQENANKVSGIQGLTGLANNENSLYNTQTGQITAQGAQVLQSLGLAYSTEAEGAQILANLAGAPSTLQSNIAQVQSLAGPVSGALSGIAAA